MTRLFFFPFLNRVIDQVGTCLGESRVISYEHSVLSSGFCAVSSEPGLLSTHGSPLSFALIFVSSNSSLKPMLPRLSGFLLPPNQHRLFFESLLFLFFSAHRYSHLSSRVSIDGLQEGAEMWSAQHVSGTSLPSWNLPIASPLTACIYWVKGLPQLRMR